MCHRTIYLFIHCVGGGNMGRSVTDCCWPPITRCFVVDLLDCCHLIHFMVFVVGGGTEFYIYAYIYLYILHSCSPRSIIPPHLLISRWEGHSLFLFIPHLLLLCCCYLWSCCYCIYCHFVIIILHSRCCLVTGPHYYILHCCYLYSSPTHLQILLHFDFTLLPTLIPHLFIIDHAGIIIIHLLSQEDHSS